MDHHRDGSLSSSASRVVILLAVSVYLLITPSSGLPTRVQSLRPASDSDSLSDILRDLENAVFRLKEYALKVDYENRKSSDSDSDFDVPSAEVKEQEHRHMLDDIYPELVAEVHEKKSSEDIKAVAANQSSSITHQQLQKLVDAASSDVGSESAVAATSGGKPSDSQPPIDDVSLREALEYLVNLAKQKKQEKRDHDIPFPITGH